ICILVLLDFTRAFDTIRHDVMLAILSYIGLSHGATELIKSFLSDRKQIVKTGDLVSNCKYIKYGVPQGSILGPLLFILYTLDFCKIINHCTIHTYADDTQLYLSTTLQNFLTAVKA